MSSLFTPIHTSQQRRQKGQTGKNTPFAGFCERSTLEAALSHCSQAGPGNTATANVGQIRTHTHRLDTELQDTDSLVPSPARAATQPQSSPI